MFLHHGLSRGSRTLRFSMATGIQSSDQLEGKGDRQNQSNHPNHESRTPGMGTNIPNPIYRTTLSQKSQKQPGRRGTHGYQQNKPSPTMGGSGTKREGNDDRIHYSRTIRGIHRSLLGRSRTTLPPRERRRPRN